MDGMMSEIEITYLTAMEEVKTISKKLVTAENAFNLVRDRIQKLIARYESMLLKIETDAHSNAGASSVVGSFYSDYDNSEYREDDDRIWARRAVRAEVRAEIAVREALLAKQAARKIQDKKAREIVSLKKKLEDLQSECSAASAEKERLMATRAMPGIDQHKSSTVSSSRISRENLDGVKQRFRDRMVSKNKPALAPSGRAPLYPSAPKHVAPSPKVQAERELIRSAGEEMYQQMVFYERSLEAVDNRRI